MRLTSNSCRVYHAYLRIIWGDAPASTCFLWSHDETAHVLSRLLVQRYRKLEVDAKTFCWRGPAPAVPDPELKDMGLDDMPW